MKTLANLSFVDLAKLGTGTVFIASVCLLVPFKGMYTLSWAAESSIVSRGIEYLGPSFLDFGKPRYLALHLVLFISAIASYAAYLHSRLKFDRSENKRSRKRFWYRQLYRYTFAPIGAAELANVILLPRTFCVTQPRLLSQSFQDLICSYPLGPGTFLFLVNFLFFYSFIFFCSWLVFERWIIPILKPNLSLWAAAEEWSILEQDESIFLEFKATLETPLGGFPAPQMVNGQERFLLGKKPFKSKAEIQKHLQTQSLKTIVAFLNSHGGRLVLGVHERTRLKQVVGLEEEEGWDDTDNYERHILQLIINRIGQRFAAEAIKISFETHGSQTITIIHVDEFTPKKGEIPAMLDGKEIYRRTGARSDRVPDGEATARFITERII